MKIKNNKNLIGIISLVLLLGFSNSVKAIAPLLYGESISDSKVVGDTFNISVKINPNNKKIDTIAGELDFSQLDCQSIELNSSDKFLVLEQPTCTDSDFIIGIKKGTLQDTELFNVTVQANDIGFSSLNFNNVDILGNGFLVSSAAIDRTFIINSITTENCECSEWEEWISQNCGEESCSEEEMLQTRSRICEPVGCNVETISRCIENSSCVVETDVVETEEITETTTTTETTTETAFNRESLLANLNRVWGGMKDNTSLTASIITIIISGGLIFGVKKWREVKREKRIRRFK
jgi:hypothetical protein